MRLLVTRPQPGADATAGRLRDMGHEPLVAPLLATLPVRWTMPPLAPEALMLTSAAALHNLGSLAPRLERLPAYCVGEATAMAARAAGLADVRTGPGTAQALVEAMAADGVTRALHLAGVNRTPVRVPPGLVVVRRSIYRARLMPLPALPEVDWVLLYSARTAGQFAAEIDRLGGIRASFSIAAISAVTLAAAGTGWACTVAAPAPSEAALLAAIGLTCQKGVEQQGS